MAKYIDADKLKAHIEAIMEILWDRLPDADKEHPTDIELRDLGMYMALEGLAENLDSLQQEQPEVDLKKEYKEYVENDPVFSKLTNRNVGLAIARHFYELGLKAQ